MPRVFGTFLRSNRTYIKFDAVLQTTRLRFVFYRSSRVVLVLCRGDGFC